MVCRPAARCSRVHARTPRTAGGVGAARRPGRLADARQAGATARSCGLSTWARRLLCPRLCTAAAPLGATTAARGSRTGAAAVGEAAAFRRPNKRRLDRSRARRWSCAISLSDSRPNCDSRFDGQRDRSRHQAGCRSCAHRSRRIVRRLIRCAHRHCRRIEHWPVEGRQKLSLASRPRIWSTGRGASAPPPQTPWMEGLVGATAQWAQ